MTMTHAILTGTRVLRLVPADEPDGVQLAVPQAHWPAPPHAGAELHCVDGALQWHDLRSIEAQRADRWAAIKAHRQQLDDEPITIDGGISLDGNEKSRNDILGAIVAMQINSATARNWRCADNVMRELTAAQIVAAGMAIAERRQQLIETSDVLWQQIQEATTAAEVAAVQWPP